MLMTNATYSFFIQAGRTAAHACRVRGADADENVTLAKGHAR
jgi:hypothetical protein